MERLTPFMIFFCEMKPSVLAENPSLQPAEVSKLVITKWKNLQDAQSRGYSVLSATYALKKDAGKNAPVRRKRPREAKDPKAPKAATSAYMYYSKYQRTLLKKENTELSFGDLGKTVGAMWKAASAEERAPFEELAGVDKERFNTTMAAYKERLSAAMVSPSGVHAPFCRQEMVADKTQVGETNEKGQGVGELDEDDEDEEAEDEDEDEEEARIIAHPNALDDGDLLRTEPGAEDAPSMKFLLGDENGAAKWLSAVAESGVVMKGPMEEGGGMQDAPGGGGF